MRLDEKGEESHGCPGADPTKVSSWYSVSARNLFYQRSQVFLIPMVAFQCAVREVAADFKDLRWQASALYHLQIAAEPYMVGLLCDTNLCALHHRCCTIFSKDLHLVCRLRGHSETGVGANMSDQAM